MNLQLRQAQERIRATIQKWRAEAACYAKRTADYPLDPNEEWSELVSSLNECADHIEAALTSPAVVPARGAPLLTIAGYVNSYHNDGTALTAAQTLMAIADVLGKPMERAGSTPALLIIDAVPEDSHMPSLKQRTGSSVRLNPRTRDLSIEQPNGGDASNELFPDGYVLIVSVPDQP